MNAQLRPVPDNEPTRDPSDQHPRPDAAENITVLAGMIGIILTVSRLAIAAGNGTDLIGGLTLTALGCAGLYIPRRIITEQFVPQVFNYAKAVAIFGAIVTLLGIATQVYEVRLRGLGVFNEDFVSLPPTALLIIGLGTSILFFTLRAYLDAKLFVQEANMRNREE